MENKWWQSVVPLMQRGNINIHRSGRHPGSKKNGPKLLAHNRAAAKRARQSRKVNR